MFLFLTRPNHQRWRLPTLVVLGMLIAMFSVAQSPSIDERLAQADTIKRADYPQFKSLLDQVEADTALTPKQRNFANYLRAWQLGYEAKYQPAIELFNTVLRDSQDATLKFRARASIVNVMTIAKQYEGAFSNLSKMLELLPHVTDRDVRSQGLMTAAQMHNAVGQYDIGIQYADQLLSEGPTERAKCPVYQMKTEAMLRRQQISADSPLLETALATCENANDRVFGNLIRSEIIRFHLEHGNPGAAIALGLAHYEEVQRTGYAVLRSMLDSLLAQAYQAQGDTAEAARYAKGAIEKAVPNEITETLVSAHRVLYEIAKQRGDSVAALAHHEKYAVADKGYLDQATAQRLAYEMVKQQAFASALKIESLNQKNQLLSLEQVLSDKTLANARLWIALLLTFLASVAVVTYRIHRSQQRFRLLAERDALTHAYTRRRFIELAEAALESAQKNRVQACLLMLDLDEFKSVNDVHGHAAGDEVLKTTAAACLSEMPRGAILGRLGGEEFAALLPGSDARGAHTIAEAMRRAVSQSNTRVGDTAIRISASIGLASALHSGYALRTLMIDADAALYRAKHAGRDRVEAYAA